MQCPLLYRYRVIDKLPEPASPAAARGTLVHAALERIFDLPAEQRTPEATIGLLPEQWDQLVEQEPEFAALCDGGEGVPDLTKWLADAGDLVQRWFTLENPQFLEPAERELYVEAECEGLTLRGYVDRLDVAPDGRLRVVDYKTGRSPSELFEGKALFQMKFYALVLWRTRGVIPTMLQLVYLKDAQILRYEPVEAELVATERKMQALWAAIEVAARNGDWRPKKSRLCSFCHHQDVCPEFGGTPPPLPDDALERALNPPSRRATADGAQQPEAAPTQVEAAVETS